MPTGVRLNTDELKEYFELGFRPSEIIEVVDSTLGTISKHYTKWRKEKKAFDREVPKPKKSIQETLKQKTKDISHPKISGKKLLALQMLQDGLNLEDTCLKSGLSFKTVEKLYHENISSNLPNQTENIEHINISTNLNVENKKLEAFALFEQGSLSQKDIAVKIAMSKSSVYLFYKEFIKLKGMNALPDLTEFMPVSTQLNLKIEKEDECHKIEKNDTVQTTQNNTQKTQEAVSIRSNLKEESKEGVGLSSLSLNLSETLGEENAKQLLSCTATRPEIPCVKSSLMSTDEVEENPLDNVPFSKYSYASKDTYVNRAYSAPQENKPQYKRGDIVFVYKNPRVPDNIRGVQNLGRPAIVIQNDVGNTHSTGIIVALMTKEIKKSHLPTHVLVRNKALSYTSMILCEQIQTIGKHYIEKVGTLDNETLHQLNKALGVSIDVVPENIIRDYEEKLAIAKATSEKSITDSQDSNTNTVEKQDALSILNSSTSKLKVRQIELDGQDALYKFSDKKVKIELDGNFIELTKSQLLSIIEELPELLSYNLL